MPPKRGSSTPGTKRSGRGPRGTPRGKINQTEVTEEVKKVEDSIELGVKVENTVELEEEKPVETIAKVVEEERRVEMSLEVEEEKVIEKSPMEFEEETVVVQSSFRVEDESDIQPEIKVETQPEIKVEPQPVTEKSFSKSNWLYFLINFSSCIIWFGF